MNRDHFFDYALLSISCASDVLAELFIDEKHSKHFEHLKGTPRIEWDYKTSLLYDPLNCFWGFESDETIASLSKISKGKAWDLIFMLDPQSDIKKPKLIKKLSQHLCENGIIICLFDDLSTLSSLYEKRAFGDNLHPSAVLRIIPYDDSTGETPAGVESCYLVCFSQNSPYNVTTFIDWTGDAAHSDGNLSCFVYQHKPSENLFKNDQELSLYLQDHTSDEGSLFLDIVKDPERHETDDEKVKQFIKNSLSMGVTEHISKFPGFEYWNILEGLSRIGSDYKTFKHVRLSSLTTNINVAKDGFKETEHAIHAAFIGDHIVVRKYQDQVMTSIENMCQIIVNPEILRSDYLVAYLNSYWGQKILKAVILEKSGHIKELSKKDVGKILIALPSLEEQKIISTTTIKIDNVIADLENLKKVITINPLSAASERNKIDSMAATMSEISPLLKEESKTHEFKASLRTPYPDIVPTIKDGRQEFTMGKQTFRSQKEIQNFLQNIVMKTICSLINTQGGTLVIGVHERNNDKKIIGIGREGFKSNDEYERHLNQLVINAFGEIVASKYIKTDMQSIDSEWICRVTCEMKSDDMPIFFDDKVYVRSGPRISQLSTQQVAELIVGRKN